MQCCRPIVVTERNDGEREIVECGSNRYRLSDRTLERQTFLVQCNRLLVVTLCLRQIRSRFKCPGSRR